MDPVNFGHSIKDIPVPSKKIYCSRLINSMEKFMQSLRWRVIFFLFPSISSQKEHFDFKSLKIPDPVEQLEDFENDLIKMVKNIEFRPVNNKFQSKLKDEKNFVHNQSRIIVAADKTTNHFLMNTKEYKETVDKHVQKEYKKVNASVVDSINNAHKSIVRKLELQDRVFRTSERQAFITAKDHKEDFANAPKFRLISPMKPELGKIAKKIFSRVIVKIRSSTDLKQMKNVYSVIEWFKKLQNKKTLSFIIYDVVNYYPSISLELLQKAIKWAKEYAHISEEEEDILIQSKNSLLFSNGSYWSKKGTNNFDNAQGSYDGAECCDLIGLYMLNEIRKLGLNLDNILYRDDGLGASCARPRQVELIKKKICKVFNDNGLQVTVEANKKVVQYLDVELNLNDDTFKPYIKPNDSPLYVNVDSNHPPSILKNIPKAINKRLSQLSSNEDMFTSVSPVYQAALDNAGYKHKLEYQRSDPAQAKKSRCRSRKVTWFNPPFSKNVKTRVGDEFFKLISKHFPKSNPLSKIINRHTVKMSYSCTPNMGKIISAHNSKLLERESNAKEKKCSCSKGEVCPLDGNCFLKDIIYQATVTTTEDPPKEDHYVGLTSTTFKERLGNHKTSFNHAQHGKRTELSKHIWKLKRKNIGYEVKFKLLDRAKPYSPVSGVCNLCLSEKYYINFHPEISTINKKDEINGFCRHKSMVLLDKT